jgi:ribulose 1,5-bisphosphate carboxylase large subunit-like protein
MSNGAGAGADAVEASIIAAISGGDMSARKFGTLRSALRRWTTMRLSFPARR